MSQRASAALKEEMEMIGPARKRDIEMAQTGIVAMIRKLEDAGEIVLGGSDDLVL
jgi:flagellar motor switch protein FliG